MTMLAVDLVQSLSYTNVPAATLSPDTSWYYKSCINGATGLSNRIYGEVLPLYVQNQSNPLRIGRRGWDQGLLSPNQLSQVEVTLRAHQGRRTRRVLLSWKL